MISLNIRHSIEGFRSRRVATRHRLPWLPHWADEQPETCSGDDIRIALRKIASSRPVSSPTKGSPDESSIKRLLADRVIVQLDAGDTVAAVREARRLTSSDMTDAASYSVFLSLASFFNSEALQLARQSISDRLVLHVSCVPRLDRAAQSSKSFACLRDDGITQITVVGSEKPDHFHFDSESMQLIVPALDTYQHLPDKVMSAMFFIWLCGNCKYVLKVDDDHRAASSRNILSAFKNLDVSRPVQLGHLVDSGALGLHSRIWHFGKTTTSNQSETPYSFVGPSRWVNGADGYFINRSALRLLAWSYVYFEDYISHSLYEDMAVSDLIERQGGALLGASMSNMVSMVDTY